MDEDKKPLRRKNLQIIDYKGTLYATFDGTRIWKLDRIAFGLIKMCDGKKTHRGIIKETARKASLTIEDTRKGLQPIFDELTRLNFIEWLD